jgi:hypothetical protein
LALSIEERKQLEDAERYAIGVVRALPKGRPLRRTAAGILILIRKVLGSEVSAEVDV